MSAAQYGYVNGILMPGRGYILVSMTDSSAKVDYLKTYLPNEETSTHHNGEVEYSYTLTSKTNGMTEIVDNLSSIHLGQNFPNPFRTETEIKYTTTGIGDVQLCIHDVFGRQIAKLVDQRQQAGTYSVKVDAAKLNLKAGIYYYTLSTGRTISSKKMIHVN